MNRKAQYAAVAAVAVAVVVLVAYRAMQPGGLALTRVVIVLDRSDSTRDACAAVAGVAERLLAEMSWPKGSTLVMLGTGDDESLGEPVELFRYSDFRRAKTVEGKAAGARRIRELLASVAYACTRTTRTRTSPIYLAVRRGAELLAVHGCAPERCALAVVSDGEETVEPGLVAALKSAANVKASASPPAAISNETSRVSFCGFAETVAAPPSKGKSRGARAEPTRNSLRADRLFDLWRGMFSRPAGVELSPICPKRKESSP